MLNKIWFWLMFIGITYGFAKGAWQSAHQVPPPAEPAAESTDTAAKLSAAKPDDAANATGLMAMGKRLNTAAFDAAKTSVDICIGLIGIMAVWLGLMNVAQDAGLIDALSRLLRPVMRLLFPELPDGHPAQGAILMNLSANMLGLDNAATPLGLKAMKELQELNPVKDTATNSMATFLAINTAGLTVIPFTIIGYRVLRGSHDPAATVTGTWLASIVSVSVAVIASRWLSKLPQYRVAYSEAPAAGADGAERSRREDNR